MTLFRCTISSHYSGRYEAVLPETLVGLWLAEMSKIMRPDQNMPVTINVEYVMTWPSQ